MKEYIPSTGTSPEKQTNSFKESLKRLTRKGVLFGSLIGLSHMGLAQTADTTKQETAEVVDPEIEKILAEKEYATLTRDGNIRFYHSPKGDASVTYAFGATQCPYETLEGIKDSTRIPESLGETDFFTNYVNAAYGSETIITDPATGNRYYDYSEANPDLDGVPYEGEKHWNIHRFLINTQYQFNYEFLPKNIARKNALFDMYKYFLYQADGNRDVAWEKANRFIVEEVDRVVESKYAKWYSEYLRNVHEERFIEEDTSRDYTKYYEGKYNIYSSNDETGLVGEILRFNKSVLDGETEGRPYTKSELEEILIDFNIIYRKKTPEEAQEIVKQNIDGYLEGIREDLQYIKERPVTETKVIQEGDYPEGYEEWDEEKKFYWDQENPDKVRRVDHGFTEEERAFRLQSLENLRFVEDNYKK